MSQALKDVSSGSQGLIPQPRFIQSISEGYFSPLLLNFYPHTSEPRTVFTPQVPESLRGATPELEERCLGAPVLLAEGASVGEEGKVDGSSAFTGEIPAYWDSTVGSKPEFASQITGPCAPLVHSSQPSYSKAVTHLTSIAQ